MTPIKEPCRVGTISTPGIIFLGKSWPTPKARATGPPCGPVTGSPSPAPRRAPVCLSCWPVLIFLGPPDAHATRRRSPCSGSHPPTPNRKPYFVVIAMTARPFKGGRSEAGGGSWPQWPERAPLQGAKVTRCISIESEPLMRRASESLNVRHEYDQQRRTRCEAWCEERAEAASPAASLRARGCVFICPINHGKQRGDVKRAGASARTSEHDRASSYHE